MSRPIPLSAEAPRLTTPAEFREKNRLPADDDAIVKAKTHDATNRCDTSRRQVASSALTLRQVAAIRHLIDARNGVWKRGNVD